MILLAMLGLLQTAFLPGWLLLRPFRVSGALDRALFILPLSLLANFEAVYLLASIHLYNRGVVLALFVLEALLAIWIAVRTRTDLAEQKEREQAAFSDARSVRLETVFLTLAALSIGWAAMIWLKKIPGVFGIGDDLVSWNRWAIQWYQGRLPARTRFYPQLLPANWSLIYQFTGTADIHIFAKALMGLFPLALLATPLAIYRATRSLAVLAATPLLAWLLGRLLFVYIAEGWTDIPLAALFLIAWLAFVLGWSKKLDVRQSVTLGMMVSCCAACLKQGGVWMVAAGVVFSAILVLRRNVVRPWPALAAVLSLSALLFIPWYGHEWYTAHIGQNRSEWEYQTQTLHHNRSITKRVIHAVSGVSAKLTDSDKDRTTFLVSTLFIILSIAALWDPVGRQAVMIGFPYFLLWAILFSYDRRNLAGALPLIAISMTSGAQVILSGCERAFAYLSSNTGCKALFHPSRLGIGVCAIAALALPALFPNDRILRKQYELLREIGYPDLDAKLYEYQKTHGFSGPILSDYLQLAYLPELGRYAEYFAFQRDVGLQSFLDACRGSVAGAPPAFVLAPSRADPVILTYTEQHFTKIFETPSYALYRIQLANPDNGSTPN